MPSEQKKNLPPRPDEQIQSEKLAQMIKHEKPGDGERLKDIPATPQNYKKFEGENSSRLPRGIVWGLLGVVVLFVVGSVFSFFIVKQRVKQSISSQLGTLQAGVTDLQNFQPQSAQQEFQSLLAGSSSTTPSFQSIVGAFGFLFKGGTAAVASFSDLARQLASLSGEIGSVQSSTFGFMTTGQGSDLVSQLTQARKTLASIDSDTDQLSNAAASVGATSTLGTNDFYLPLRAKISGAENFLDAFIPWLASSTPHHVLVMLQNPSELRPGGGFLGSYADVTLADGNITGISIHDVADVDSAFAPKIVPPKPLQLEVNNFRPADANWFFDFPTSASKTIQFFETSKLFAASSTTFDGAIAVSPAVMSDLLSITGPIKISGTTFTSSTLMVQLQSIVQQGQAQSATYPKAVLSSLAQAVFEEFASSTDADKQQLLSVALDAADKKDVMAYFKDPDIENFLTTYGVGGEVYQLPQNFNGDYFALVDVNIRGDKSDLYIAQKVTLDAQINADGTITDSLVIDRTHHGNQSPYWWYQTTSQDYMQVFVPDGSSLVTEAGGIKKTVPPPINYAKNGYSTDPTVATIESSTQLLFIYPAVTTHEESGKEVFATWSRVAKGQSTEIDFDYSHRAFLSPANGTPYQFIFEKQSGTNRSYDFTIDAPLGYVFAENNIATYEYQSSDPPGRLIINLTLKKL